MVMGGRVAGRRPAREVADGWRRARKTATRETPAPTRPSSRASSPSSSPSSSSAAASADSPGDASASARSWFPEGERVRHRPGRGSKAALAAALAALTRDPAGAGPAGVGPLGAAVDCVVAARRLAGWSLWVELAGLAQLIAFWECHPPLDQDVVAAPTPLHSDDCDDADDPDYPDRADWERPATELADRLSSLVIGLQLPADVHLGDLAELFVTSEISAATGVSRTATGQRVDAARALFLDDRLPRTRALLRAGLLDWTKLRTLLV